MAKSPVSESGLFLSGFRWSSSVSPTDSNAPDWTLLPASSAGPWDGAASMSTTRFLSRAYWLANVLFFCIVPKATLHAQGRSGVEV